VSGFSGGAIGSTSPFGGDDEGSNPSPRARAENEAPALGGSASMVAPVKPAPLYSSNILPAPCRACGGPSWLQDDLGAVHPCCVLMWTKATGCISCKASATLNKEHRRRHLTKANSPASLLSHTKGEAPLTERES
jgi:hypothetical protein